MSTKEAALSSQRARIMLVDDHPAVRSGLADLINREPDLVVCGEAGSRTEALQLMTKAAPDLVIVDLMLKDSNRLELVKDATMRFPRVALLVASMHDEAFHAERAIRAGAHGYINKQAAMSQIMDAIRCVLRGEVYLSPDMASAIAAKSLSQTARTQVLPSDLLSDRELQVLNLLGQGYPTPQVATMLGLDGSTIATYRLRIKEKLNLKNAHDLLQYAIRWRESQVVSGSQMPPENL